MLNNLLLGQTAEEKLYVEDVFSTYLYTGTGSSQIITTGLNLLSKGGMVWLKSRSDATDHAIYDKDSDINKDLITNLADGQILRTSSLTAFRTTGFTVGTLAKINTNTSTYTAWTFIKSAKFFDCVTWTGNGANRTISHALGVVPGLIIVKRTDTTGDWQVYHRSLANTEYLVLNTTAAKATGTTRWNSTTPTATEFSLGTDATVNANGGTYVAYLFAHDTTADGIVQCGSFTTDASGNATVNLGWEPQFVLVKKSSAAGDSWWIFDNMRGFSLGGSNALVAEQSSAETALSANMLYATATGFQHSGLISNNSTAIYLAIRRGPMRVPTDATKVFKPIIYTGDGTSTKKLTTDFPVDLGMLRMRSVAGSTDNMVVDRLRGIGTASPHFYSLSTGAEGTGNYAIANNVSYQLGNGTTRANNDSAEDFVAHFFRRAPGFFDVVCYTGTGSASTVSHNLGVAPELMIVKRRDTTGDWQVYAGASGEYLVLNTTAAKVSSNTDRWNNTAPTSTVFSLGTNAVVNASGGTYVAYLFATCAGVSKVGTYTGTGTTKQIDCGFTNGARFVLIKCTDSTGNWTVWDTARGIVSGNDPYLLLNSSAAEVTNTDYIDPLSTGFEISSTAPAAINANGGTFVFLAIA